MRIGLLVGSLRKESWNRKVAEVVKEFFPKNYEVDFIEIKDVPLYNEDLDTGIPHEAYQRLRESVRAHDGFIFFTPEYNRSYAPALKNAMDVVSRDSTGNGWAKKPAAVFSVTMGGFGGMAANHALRQVFIYLDMIPLQQPEIYLAKIHEAFHEGQLDERTCAFLQHAVAEFVVHAEKLR
ncbi:MAG: NAD(P)H-dependent oxidoreductase [Acidaminococcaceae bacterium]|nr:NAD(P)H-dependent oxidoreductase [Acidaminococcaceae bacterium]